MVVGRGKRGGQRFSPYITQAVFDTAQIRNVRLLTCEFPVAGRELLPCEFHSASSSSSSSSSSSCCCGGSGGSGSGGSCKAQKKEVDQLNFSTYERKTAFKTLGFEQHLRTLKPYRRRVDQRLCPRITRRFRLVLRKAPDILAVLILQKKKRGQYGEVRATNRPPSRAKPKAGHEAENTLQRKSKIPGGPASSRKHQPTQKQMAARDECVVAGHRKEGSAFLTQEMYVPSPCGWLSTPRNPKAHRLRSR